MNEHLQDILERYRNAREWLEKEQEFYRTEKQRDMYHRMRAEYHEAIKMVRILAVEIADEVAWPEGRVI